MRDMMMRFGGQRSMTCVCRGCTIVVEVSEVEVRQHYIEILDRYRDQKVVAVIELVSPSNKVAGAGREAYLLKQQQVRGTEAHFIEIDLLRYGAHVLSVPEIYTRS